jgi:hypothetical protein
MEFVKEARIDFKRFGGRLEPLEESFDSLARRDAIVASLHEQNGKIDHRIINDLLSGPYRFEIESNRNKFMQQIEIFERIQMRLIMRQIPDIHVCRKSNPGHGSVERTRYVNLPKRRRLHQSQPGRACNHSA